MKPSNDWIYEQAKSLSTRKDVNSVGALAWNLSVAFSRWDAASQELSGASGPPTFHLQCPDCGAGEGYMHRQGCSAKGVV
jgi:hypothetical protein